MENRVLLFDTERLTKIAPKWTSLWTVIGKQRQSSYRLETGERSTVAHANRLRSYHARGGHVGVVFVEGVEFEEVE